MPTPWETEEIGRRILQAFPDDDGFVFVVVRSLEVFQELKRLNGSSMCRWLSTSTSANQDGYVDEKHRDDIGNDDSDGDDDGDDARSTSTLKTDLLAPDLGVICLQAPRFAYEKTKAGLPTCFLFGRKSTQRKSSTWAVRNLGDFSTVVNRDVPLGPGSPSFALWPGRGSLLQVADLELEVYCRDPRDAAAHLSDTPSSPITLPVDGTDASGTTSLTTAEGLPDTNVPPELDSRLYILQHQRLKSRRRAKFLSMDPWTCVRYVAKQYRPSRAAILKERLDLLRGVPLCSPFMRDERLHTDPDAVYLLTRYREDVYTLQEVKDLATPELARKLLRVLLRIVASLHQRNVVHNDICLSTVFVVGELDTDPTIGNILLSGFSEASANMTRATNDCFQVFQTVQDFLGSQAKLTSCWTGDEHLDRLWRHLVSSKDEPWPYTAQQVCDLSDISRTEDVEEPKIITVSKSFQLRHTSHEDVSYLDVDDVREYLSKDAVRWARRGASPHQIKAIVQLAFTALEACTRDGRITVQDYYRFCNHMKERHGHRHLGRILSASLPDKYYIEKPFELSLSFPVPFLSRYGLVNLEYLRSLASSGFDPDILRPLLPHCHEVRGFPEARGVYVSVAHLEMVTELLGVRVEENYDFEPPDASLDEYTYQDWYLLAPNSMSRIFPVNRTTNQVLTSPSPPTYASLRDFLEDHVEAKSYLDSQVVHDPKKLFMPDEPAEKLPLNSCEGSVEASSHDSLLFRFRSRALPKPSLLVEAKEKRRDERMSAWMREQEEERRIRRRGTGDRADIVRTEFVFKKRGA